MKPTRRIVRRSFMDEVTGGFGQGAPGGGGKPMPPTDADLHAPEKPGKAMGDSDH